MNKIKKYRLFTAVGYKAGAVQEKGHFSDKRNVFIIGGNRSGKSVFASMEALAQFVEPNTVVWTVAPTYELADKVYRRAYNLATVDLGMPLLKDVSTPSYFMACNGTQCWAKSVEKLKSLEGESVNLGVLDEIGFYNQVIWQRLVVRFDKPDARIVIVGTPKGKNAWLKRFWDEKCRDKENWMCLKMPTDEQPYVSKEFLEQAERELGGKKSAAYREQIKGEFVSYGLLVYPMFNQENIGVTDFGKRWKFVIGVDSGYVHPCTAGYWAIGVGDDCYKLAEYNKVYETRAKNAVNIAEMANHLMKEFNIRFSSCFYPPEDPAFAQELKKSFNKLGTRVKRANNDVEKGIELVRRLLQDRIRINPNCKHTIYNYQNYCHKPDSEKIMKINDDQADADRYALLSHFGSRASLPYKMYA